MGGGGVAIGWGSNHYIGSKVSAHHIWGGGNTHYIWADITSNYIRAVCMYGARGLCITYGARYTEYLIQANPMYQTIGCLLKWLYRILDSCQSYTSDYRLSTQVTVENA